MRRWRLVGVALGALVCALGAGSASAAGSDLIFDSSGRVVSIPADGSGRTVLIDNEGPADESGLFAPELSPDGSRLAVAQTFPASENFGDSSHLAVANADGSGLAALTPQRQDSSDGDPAWSPDSLQIAFARFSSLPDSLRTEIIVTTLDGRERIVASHTTTRRLVFFTAPAWSPDGRTLLFTRTTLDDDATFRHSLYTVDANGGQPRLLRADAGDADYSPDGTRIAYSDISDENGEYCGSDECSIAPELYVMDSDGTDGVRLTRNKGFDESPDWSADSQWIAFASDRNNPPVGSPEIYTIRPDGSCLSWLTNGTALSRSPNWNPSAPAAVLPPCGLTDRAPLIETAQPPRRSDSRRVLWLGPQRRGAILSDMRETRGGIDLTYDDCARFDPRGCPPPLYLRERNACGDLATNSLVGGYLTGLAVRRGVLTAYTSSDRVAELWSGGSHIELLPESTLRGQDERRDLRRAIAGLRPVGSRVAERLPASELPPEAFGTAKRAATALEQFGDVAEAAEHLGISEVRLRRRVKLDRVLERHPRIGKANC